MGRSFSVSTNVFITSSRLKWNLSLSSNNDPDAQPQQWMKIGVIQTNAQTIAKKIRSKNFKKNENQCQNAAFQQKTTSKKVKFDSNKKLGIEWTENGL